MPAEDYSDRTERRWQPGHRVATVLAFGHLVLLVLALVAFADWYQLWHPDGAALPVQGQLGILVLVVVLVGATSLVLVVHEAVHAVVMLLIGIRPQVKVARDPYLRFVQTDGASLPRGKFLLLALTPVVGVTCGLLALIALGPWPGWWVLPAAVHVAASTPDVVYAVVAARARPGSQFTLVENGLLISEPVTESADDLP